MLEPTKVERFRATLLRQKEHVVAEMSEHQPLVDRHSSTEERADRAASHLVETRINENDGNLLQKIEHALERIDAGTYHLCEHCGEEIPAARLEAKPSVSLCVNCQEKKDAGSLPRS
ncbi:MAG: TraR/DksA family transcriptional regulator [Haloferula sp.]